MKKRSLLFICFVLCFCNSVINAQTFGGGSGTADDPFLIMTKAHLEAICLYDKDKSIAEVPHFRLENDIDLNEGVSEADKDKSNWNKMISPTTTDFRCINFDGNGKVISNLRMRTTIGYTSFFGMIYGEIKDLGLVNVDIVSTQSSAAAFGGYLGHSNPADKYRIGKLIRCFSTGRVEGAAAVGGLVGNMGKSYIKEDIKLNNIIQDCYSSCEVVANYLGNATTTTRSGGLIGWAYNNTALPGIIENCYSRGKVSASKSQGIGGLVGNLEIPLKNCIAWNELISNKSNIITDRLGAVAALADESSVQSKSENVWACSDIVMMAGGEIISRTDMQGNKNSFMGIEKDPKDLTINNISNGLGWDFNNTWGTIKDYDYPVLKWVADREDAKEITTGIIKEQIQSKTISDITISSIDNGISIQSSAEIRSIEIFSTNGVMITQVRPNISDINIDLNIKNEPLIIRVTTLHDVITKKVIF